MNDKLNDLIAMEEWKGMPPEEREWLTFRFLAKIDKRLLSLERHKWFDKGVLFTGAVFGGIIGFFTSRIWGS